ncbi:MAG: hypothetical protein CNLJKLNK_00502 [Holosporales bacterium]
MLKTIGKSLKNKPLRCLDFSFKTIRLLYVNPMVNLIKNILYEVSFMNYTKKMVFIFLMIQMCSFLQASQFPPGVSGTACFDYFTEYLPPASRGIYKIYGPDHRIKYIGSSCDIDKRLSSHLKNGLLEQGDIVFAIVFDNRVRQKQILDYEKSLIGKFSPPFNKHAGAPGRSWRSEQISKLQTFSDHNWHLLKPQAKVMIKNLLAGKMTSENQKMAKSLLRIMGLFL